jgi:hypothetical protein
MKPLFFQTVGGSFGILLPLLLLRSAITVGGESILFMLVGNSTAWLITGVTFITLYVRITRFFSGRTYDVLSFFPGSVNGAIAHFCFCPDGFCGLRI